MAYRIERTQQWGEPFHLEIDLRGRRGAVIPGGLTDVAFALNACGCANDYGERGPSRSEIASTADGKIVTTADDIVVIDIPADRFRGLVRSGQTLRCELAASRDTFRSVIATILISFEGCC